MFIIDGAKLLPDLPTEVPSLANGGISRDGNTITYHLRDNVQWHDVHPLRSDDVAFTYRLYVNPKVNGYYQQTYARIAAVTTPDRLTVVLHLRAPFASALYQFFQRGSGGFVVPRHILEQSADVNRDPFSQHPIGTGPFRFAGYEAGQSIKGVRNPDYYRPGLPYLDGFIGIYADKQAVRVDALRADRASIEFRGFPPSVRDELKQALGDQITVEESDWNCSNLITPNHGRKPFDDLRVRRALTLALDRWHGAHGLAKIAIMRKVGGAVFPGSPLAATRQELEQLAGFWPNIEESRAEARRLLKEAGAESLKFELLNRTVDQPFKYLGAWLVDEWSKVGLQVTQRVVPTGPWIESMRTGNFDVTIEGGCGDLVNPLVDTRKYLPRSGNPENYGNFGEPTEGAVYDRMLRDPYPAKRRVLMRQFE